MAISATKRPTIPSTAAAPVAAHTDRALNIARQSNNGTLESRTRKPVDIVHAVTDAVVEASWELQTNLKFVRTGVVYNVTDSAYVSGVVIVPKASDTSIAVITGISASKVYLMTIIGRK